MKIRITRTVIVSTPIGMKRFAPGLEVTVTDDEAAQVFRQKAGVRADVDQASQPAAPATKAAKAPKAPKTAKPQAKEE